MTAKEDLVEPNTNGDGQPVITPTMVNLTEQQQAPPPDYETSIKQENEIEEAENDNETGKSNRIV